MSLQYILIEDDFKGNREEIGDIMMHVSSQLYNATGLKLCNYIEVTSNGFDLQKQNDHGNLEILNEEVLWKNLSNDEKVQKFSEYLNKIGAISGNLIIIDPYIFPKKYDNSYKDLITRILNIANFKSLKIITNQYNYNNTLYNEVKKSLVGNSIEVIFNNDFHDRFWIANRNKAFLVGSSLNGIGKKISSINYIDDDDIQELLKVLDNTK